MFAVARAVIRARLILKEKADCKQSNDSQLRNNESIEIKPLNRWGQSNHFAIIHYMTNLEGKSYAVEAIKGILNLLVAYD